MWKSAKETRLHCGSAREDRREELKRKDREKEAHEPHQSRNFEPELTVEAKASRNPETS